MEQLDLDALADFVLVATHGGLGKAARRSGRSKATLSRRLSDLEASLGLRLLERGAQQLKLTEAGAALLARARGPLAELRQAGDDIRNGGTALAGTLRVSAPVLLSHLALSRIAAEFSRLHPALDIEITAEDRFVDPIEEGYDLVLRTNPSPNEHMVGRRLFTDQLLLATVPDFPLPADGDTLPAVVMHRASDLRPWLITTPSGPVTYRPRAVLRLSSMLMVRDAVLAGAGAALLPISLIGPDLAAGRLVDRGAAEGRPVEVWVLHATQRLASPKVTRFVSFLAEQFPEGRLDHFTL